MKTPKITFHPSKFPDVQRNLNILNKAALLDQETTFLQHPIITFEKYESIITALFPSTINHNLDIVSFDIDLTLDINDPDDNDNEIILINPNMISEMQKIGYIVGTCSDREPSNQYDLMVKLGQHPDFCIPKEMLKLTRILIPGNSHLHIGDDPRRDKAIANLNGWTHLYPTDFLLYIL